MASFTGTLPNQVPTNSDLGELAYIDVEGLPYLPLAGGTMTGAINFASGQFGTNVNTFLTTPSSANLAAALTDETGTGVNVFNNTPTLITPLLGTPTSGDLSNCTNAVGYKLKSATTIIDVSAATAPTAGQLLIATDSTNATWQTSPYLPLTGGTITGLLTTKEFALTKTAPSISAGVLTLDFSLSNTYAVSLNASITSFTVSNIPTTGSYYEFNLEFTADGTARSVTWTFSSVAVKWPGGIAPTLTSTNGKKDTFVFYTYDAGTTWLGFIAGQNL